MITPKQAQTFYSDASSNLTTLVKLRRSVYHSNRHSKYGSIDKKNDRDSSSQLNNKPSCDSSRLKQKYSQFVLPKKSGKQVAARQPTFTSLHNTGYQEDNFEQPHSVSRALSRGKLQLGLNNKPVMILPREQRCNPWASCIQIDEDILKKKGIFDLLAMGAINKTVNCHNLLNYKYQIVSRKAYTQSATFLTALTPMVNTFVENSTAKEQNTQPEPVLGNTLKGQIQVTESTVSLATKKRKIKASQSKKVVVFEPIETKIVLQMLNYQLVKNQAYQAYIYKILRNGMQPQFDYFINKMHQFVRKYNLLRIQFTPELNETCRITESNILSSIKNHKVCGIDLRIKGSRHDMFYTLLKMKIARVKFKKIVWAVESINQLKKRFRINKYYKDMALQRWRFISFKLAYFAQSQRRLAQTHKENREKVQIHLLATNHDQTELSTFYKAKQRIKIQLTRIFASDTPQMIILIDHIDPITRWLDLVASMRQGSINSTVIHVIPVTFEHNKVEQYGKVYFGINQTILKKIKGICKDKKAVLYPYSISNYLPKICEYLQIGLFAGSFTNQSLQLLNEEQQEPQQAIITNIDQQTNILSFAEQNVDNNLMTKVIKHQLQLALQEQTKVGKLQLANAFYSSKYNIKRFLSEQEYIKTPLAVVKVDQSIDEFLRQMSELILTTRQQNRWILKLPNQTFSRGLAILETDSLKILKEKKKKLVISNEDIDEIKGIIKDILVQKMVIPQDSLLNGDQYIEEFLAGNGYIQAVIENASSVCVFGRIQCNGEFTFVGSYRKYSCGNITFGALYPAKEVTQSLISSINELSRALNLENVYGNITFELLYEQKTNMFWFIDIVPHLEQYSSLHFLYRQFLTDLQYNTIEFNCLPRHIFYIPFIDNNGNTCKDIRHFLALCREKKIVYDNQANVGQQFLFLGNDLPDVLSLVCFSHDETMALKLSLDGLSFLIDIGGQFTKFDKKDKKGRSDGLYIMDIMWKLRQIRKNTVRKILH